MHLRRVNESLVERVEFFERGQLKSTVREIERKRGGGGSGKRGCIFLHGRVLYCDGGGLREYEAVCLWGGVPHTDLCRVLLILLMRGARGIGTSAQKTKTRLKKYIHMTYPVLVASFDELFYPFKMLLACDGNGNNHRIRPLLAEAWQDQASAEGFSTGARDPAGGPRSAAASPERRGQRHRDRQPCQRQRQRRQQRRAPRRHPDPPRAQNRHPG